MVPYILAITLIASSIVKPFLRISLLFIPKLALGFAKFTPVDYKIYLSLCGMKSSGLRAFNFYSSCSFINLAIIPPSLSIF